MVLKYLKSFFSKKEKPTLTVENTTVTSPHVGDLDMAVEHQNDEVEDFSDYGIVTSDTETEQAIMEERRRKHHERKENPEVIVENIVIEVVIEENYSGHVE